MRRPSPAEVRLARAWLTRVVEPGRGPVFELVSDVGPVEAARRMRAGAAEAAVSSLAAARRREDRAADDLAQAERLGGRLVTPEDPEWPDEALRALQVAYDRERDGGRRGEPVELTPPLALWALGPVRVADVFARSVAVVGSRNATPYGEHVAADLGHGLAARGWTVVSGGAFGIDAAAHRGALAAAGPTVAVLAGGLLSPYPQAHAGLFRRIAADGLLVTELPPDATPQRHRFLVRNRLVAALTAATVVVEAGLRSGALATARQALRMGKRVLGVPGPVTSGESAGVHALLRAEPELTTLVTRPAEVLEEVGAVGELVERRSGPVEPRDGLEPLARQVLDGLPALGVASPDRIAGRCGVPALDVLRALPGLEVLGFVEATPAGWQLTAAARATRPR
jgi:DNA processing protein